MSSERPGKSHATTWVLSILAVLVLYVLTYPAVAWIGMHAKNPAWISPSEMEIPDWLEVYGAPYGWLAQTPLRILLNPYSRWAWERMGSI